MEPVTINYDLNRLMTLNSYDRDSGSKFNLILGAWSGRIYLNVFKADSKGNPLVRLSLTTQDSFLISEYIDRLLNSEQTKKENLEFTTWNTETRTPEKKACLYFFRKSDNLPAISVESIEHNKEYVFDINFPISRKTDIPEDMKRNMMIRYVSYAFKYLAPKAALLTSFKRPPQENKYR